MKEENKKTKWTKEQCQYIYKILTIEGYAEADSLYRSIDDDEARKYAEGDRDKLFKVLTEYKSVRDHARDMEEKCQRWIDYNDENNEKVPYPIIFNQLRMCTKLLKAIADQKIDGYMKWKKEILDKQIEEMMEEEENASKQDEGSDGNN